MVWATDGLQKAIARFEVTGARVEVSFTENGEWRVGFDVTSLASVPESIRILSGVFQAVQEFLVVREPKRLVFVAKAESIGKIYETYLFKQEGALAELGYRTIPPVKASPFVEFRIEKTTSSTWNN